MAASHLAKLKAMTFVMFLMTFCWLLMHSELIFSKHRFYFISEKPSNCTVESQLSQVQRIQRQINNVTSFIQQHRLQWSHHSTVVFHDWISSNAMLHNKTILFIGDSTMRNTFAYLTNCVCVVSETKFSNNGCSKDQLFIPSKGNDYKYKWAINKGQSPKRSLITHCRKYNATLVWHKLWARDINIQISAKITKAFDMNLSNVSETVITNPRQDSNALLNRLSEFKHKTDIVIWNQGTHLHVELRKTNTLALQKRQSENIALLAYYELYLSIFKTYVWRELKRSNESCLFFQTSQPQNCEMMYGDRLYLFKSHKNDSLFHNHGFKDWNDYVQQCSNMKDIPTRICDEYWTCNEHKPLNSRMLTYVNRELRTSDSKVFVSDVGYLLNDTDFCHHNDFIHKLKCSGAKAYYYAKISRIASC